MRFSWTWSVDLEENKGRGDERAGVVSVRIMILRLVREIYLEFGREEEAFEWNGCTLLCTA